MPNDPTMRADLQGIINEKDQTIALLTNEMEQYRAGEEEFMEKIYIECEKIRESNRIKDNQLQRVLNEYGKLLNGGDRKSSPRDIAGGSEVMQDEYNRQCGMIDAWVSADTTFLSDLEDQFDSKVH